MNSRQLTILAFKFAGFMVAAYALVAMFSVTASLIRTSVRDGFISSSVFPSIVVAIAITGVIGGLAMIWSAKSAVKSTDMNLVEDLKLPHAVQILGVYFAAQGMASLPGQAEWMLERSVMEDVSYWYIFSSIFNLLLGLLLITCPQTAVNLLAVVRKK